MADLIEQLERATGPDRELDLAIWNLVFPDDINPVAPVPAFTGSIDAALALVPEGGRLLELGQWQDGGRPDGWFAQVTAWLRDGEFGWLDKGFSYGVPEQGATQKPKLAPNGAIALCIAALKARSA